MTGKERILAALSGKKPDRVPFSPNIWQWFYANDYNGTLPPEAKGLSGPSDVLRLLGADLLSKFDSPKPKPTYGGCDYTFEFAGGLDKGRAPWSSFGDTFAGGRIRNERMATPRGELTHAWEYCEEAGYYARIDPELGRRFCDEIESLIHDIRRHPDRFPLFAPPVRRHFSNVFPYCRPA